MSDTNRARRSDRENNPRIAAHRPSRKQRDCTAVGVCAKGIKTKLNTLDEADFVRDGDNPVLDTYLNVDVRLTRLHCATACSGLTYGFRRKRP